MLACTGWQAHTLEYPPKHAHTVGELLPHSNCVVAGWFALGCCAHCSHLLLCACWECNCGRVAPCVFTLHACSCRVLCLKRAPCMGVQQLVSLLLLLTLRALSCNIHTYCQYVAANTCVAAGLPVP